MTPTRRRAIGERNTLAIAASEPPRIEEHTMSKHDANTKLVEITRLLGIEAKYFAGMYGLRYDGQYLGQMVAEAWLDHFRRSALQVRS